jgi:hypothetical protein
VHQRSSCFLPYRTQRESEKKAILEAAEFDRHLAQMVKEENRVAQSFVSHPSTPARGALSEVEGQKTLRLVSGDKGRRVWKAQTLRYFTTALKSLLHIVQTEGIRLKMDVRLKRYRRRWKIEGLFAWLQNFRRLVVRYERHAENFLGMLELASSLILLRHL